MDEKTGHLVEPWYFKGEPYVTLWSPSQKHVRHIFDKRQHMKRWYYSVADLMNMVDFELTIC
jgi:hypothetical protein